jgi:prepilin-type N-terminal cleavage/methylation domain-containing protein
MITTHRKGFTLVEIIVAATLGALILGGTLKTFVFFARSTVRLANYADMERQATRALELLARDVRMASKIDTDAPTAVAPTTGADRVIKRITLTVQNTAGSFNIVKYEFVAASGTLTRVVDGGTADVVVRNVVSSGAQFYAYNTKDPKERAKNDLETTQIQILMTANPDTKGLYATTTKRIISARFVLRNG